MNAKAWKEAAPWRRTEIAAAALSLASPEACFSGITATQLHGLPGRVHSPYLHLDKPTRGHLGRGIDTYAAKGAARSLRRAPLRFVHHRGAPWDGVPVRAGHFITVPLDIAVVEVAASEPFWVALPVVDAVLRAPGQQFPTRERLLELVEAWPVRTQ